MSWPAAHRSEGARNAAAASRGAGAQAPSRPVPRPANDNIRLPTPANDNVPPRRPLSPAKSFGRRLPVKAANLARRSLPWAKFLRVHPLINAALLAYDVYELWQWLGQERPALDGWYLHQRCRPGASTLVGNWTGTCQRAAIPPGSVGPPAPTANVQSWWYTRGEPGPFGWTYYYPQVQYRRTTTGVGAAAGQRYPAQRPQPVPRPRPEPWITPWVDPFIVPPIAPVPDPGVQPRAAQRPATANDGNWSENGNQTRKRPRARPKARWKHKPPGPKTKERKSKARVGVSLVLRGGYALTEGKDMIEALHDGVWYPVVTGPNKVDWRKTEAALPERFQSQSDDVWEKSQALYRHWDEVDLSTALMNLALNQVIDLAVGAPQGQLTNWANQHGFVHGGAFDGPAID